MCFEIQIEIDGAFVFIRNVICFGDVGVANLSFEDLVEFVAMSELLQFLNSNLFRLKELRFVYEDCWAK